MQCPRCGVLSADAWLVFQTYVQHQGIRGATTTTTLQRGREYHYSPVVTFDWMRCVDEECSQLVVRVHETEYEWVGEGTLSGPIEHTETYPLYPRGGVSRRLDAAVPDRFRKDYTEAAAIIDLSPRMSAVLARRILGDLLRLHGKTKSKYLTPQIDEFNKNKSHPRRLRDNLHHFREVSDFCAHTQESDEGEIIDVSREEAEWTLDITDRLFEYFIIERHRDLQMREAMDEKGKKAGRTAIPPLPKDEDD